MRVNIPLAYAPMYVYTSLNSMYKEFSYPIPTISCERFNSQQYIYVVLLCVLAQMY